MLKEELSCCDGARGQGVSLVRYFWVLVCAAGVCALTDGERIPIVFSDEGPRGICGPWFGVAEIAITCEKGG